MTKRSIAVIDDEAAVRDSLCALLGTFGYAAHPFASVESLTGGHRGQAPDVILVDVNMPGIDGISAQRLFRQRFPGTPVIVVTGYASIPLAVKAMREGAADFLEKPVSDAELARAIEDSLSKVEARRAGEAWQQELRERLAQLTAREADILALVVQGHTSQSIAANRGIAKKTVDHHRASIMSKMKATSISQLIRFAMEAQVR